MCSDLESNPSRSEMGSPEGRKHHLLCFWKCTLLIQPKNDLQRLAGGILKAGMSLALVINADTDHLNLPQVKCPSPVLMELIFWKPQCMAFHSFL